MLFRHRQEVGERCAAWTSRMLWAAGNSQWTAKDPGAFAHNGLEIFLTLEDRLTDMGYDVACLVCLEVPHAG